MSEIDKPASQSPENTAAGAVGGSATEPPAWPSAADATSTSAAPSEPAMPQAPSPAGSEVPQTSPPAATPYEVVGYPAAGSSASADASGSQWDQSAAAWASGDASADSTAQQPVYAGQPAYQGQPSYPGQPGQPGYGGGGYPPVPPSGPPAWTPPAGNGPKKVPTAVKVVAGGAAAVLLALCSGVTGAVVATTISDKGGITLPVSTDTAPVVDRSTLSGVAAKTQPSVVNIATGSGEGSGVILTEDGYILTNNHVIESASGGNVTVTLSTGKKVKAKVVGADPKTDLAVIKAEATGLKAATLGDSNKVAVGDTVLAIGSPLGLQGSVTSGIISAKDRTISAGQSSTSLSGLLQTDAPINPGNSGGALVNTNGDVVGINTAIATSGGGEGNIGVGFAIPSNKAKQVAEQLMNGQKVSHPFLGVSVTAEETGGAKIGTISPNSPAAAAGLKEGDVITKFGDRVVNDSDDLVSAVQSGTVGQKVTVEFSRNGENQTATVTLGEAS